MKFYFDTAILRDYFENREDNLRPIGEWAFQLLSQIKARRDVLLVSELVLFELGEYYSQEEINELFKPFEKVSQKIKITHKQTSEAESISRKRQVPKGDALHAILARDNDAVLVTRDHHFEEITDICKSHKPEELI